MNSRATFSLKVFAPAMRDRTIAITGFGLLLIYPDINSLMTSWKGWYYICNKNEVEKKKEKEKKRKENEDEERRGGYNELGERPVEALIHKVTGLLHKVKEIPNEQVIKQRCEPKVSTSGRRKKEEGEAHRGLQKNTSSSSMPHTAAARQEGEPLCLISPISSSFHNPGEAE